MKNRIKVLGIAPYEGMKAHFSLLSEEYPEIDFSFFVGNLQEGVEIAQRNFHSEYDVVVSRGGTARLLQSRISLPVVEVTVSSYDILCALKMTDGLPGPVAMVAFSNITENAKRLCTLLNYEIHIVTVEQENEVEASLQEVKRKGYQMVLCDVIASNVAKKLGLNAFLISSGIDSIRQALNHIVQLFANQSYLREENSFLREIVRRQMGQTVIFHTNGELFFSSQSDLEPELLDILYHEIAETQKEGQRRMIKNLNGMTYSIRAECMNSGSRAYTVFFFFERKASLAPNQQGIRFFTRQESETFFYESFLNITGVLADLEKELITLNQSVLPVMLCGEDGTGKDQVASILYTRSSLKNNPMVQINCSLLNKKSWEFLFENHNSPFADTNSTIYFSNIDALLPEQQRQLLAVLEEMDVHQRNRTVFSCLSQRENVISEVGLRFVNTLGCTVLQLPALRQQAKRIPGFIGLSLNHMNVNMAMPVLSIEPEGVRLLQHYHWPYNYAQFKRVIKELAVLAENQVITAKKVASLLGEEKNTAAFSHYSENATRPLDLTRTLDEITQDIALRVLEDIGGNQTLAAKQLGISRTTLWRLLREK
ncbi:PrpR N-terminal domain-containing protein [Oscillospiraceae bacterium MB08-C2-2]|nr:PrpR N-terminal domain-containing protein [Oscillospiraceae bacterium MB08-C2-2]